MWSYSQGVADNTRAALKLYDGMDLPATVFAAHRNEVSLFVHSGNVVFVTFHGHRRMAMVPVDVGEAWRRHKEKARAAPGAAAAAGAAATNQTALELCDGMDLPATVFAAHRNEVSLFVYAGNLVFLTFHAHRRLALVPSYLRQEQLILTAAMPTSRLVTRSRQDEGES